MTDRTSGPQIDLTGRGHDNLTLSFPVEKADSAKRASGAARRMPKASTMIKKANIDRASAELINRAAPLPGSKIAGRDESKDNLRALYDLPWEYQLEYASEIGLGENGFDLVEI